MSFCEHCEGQRFDRARILRVLREARKRLQHGGGVCTADEALQNVLQEVRSLDVPHLERFDEVADDEVVH
jgi:hypothetical protein